MLISPEISPYLGNWKVSTDPSIEPITLAELKEFARIDGDDEDTLLESLITSARTLVENYLNRALIEQVITLRLDEWPGEIIELPRPPLLSIVAVETLDEDDVATVYDSDNYYISTVSEPGLLLIKNGVVFPQNTNRYYGGFQIRYKAGYGDETTDVPEVIRNCIKQWATALYENRALGEEPPTEIKSILNNYRILNV